MRVLADENIREISSVKASIPYMFPCTQLFETHTGGWHAVHRICINAAVLHPQRLTATKKRHRHLMFVPYDYFLTVFFVLDVLVHPSHDV